MREILVMELFRGRLCIHMLPGSWLGFGDAIEQFYANRQRLCLLHLLINSLSCWNQMIASKCSWKRISALLVSLQLYKHSTFSQHGVVCPEQRPLHSFVSNYSSWCVLLGWCIPLVLIQHRQLLSCLTVPLRKVVGWEMVVRKQCCNDWPLFSNILLSPGR